MLIIIAWIALLLVCLFAWEAGPGRTLFTIKIAFVCIITGVGGIFTFIIMNIFIGIAQIAHDMQEKLLKWARRLHEEWKEGVERK